MGQESNVCSRCRGEVHPEALACPNCGATFANTAEFRRQKKAEEEGSLWGCFVIVLLFGGALLFVLFD